MGEQSMSTNDRELARKAGQGDEQAFAELFSLYHDRVYAVVYRFCRKEADADELTQQVWIKVWKKLHTYKGDSAFFTWLYRVVSFHCLDDVRKKKRRNETEWLEEYDYAEERVSLPASPSRPDRELERKEVREMFNAALARLKPEHKMALIFREVEGLSYDEIAAAMKCRKGTVMSRIFYARKAIQEHLQEVRAS